MVDSERKILLVVSLAFFLLTGLFFYAWSPAWAAWPSDPSINVEIGRSYNQEWHPQIIRDGSDGAIILWEEYNGSYFKNDLIAQRIDAGGNVLWGAGVMVSTEKDEQHFAAMIGDGAGGAYIVWSDRRNQLTTEYDIYGQHVNASGNVQWGTDGKVICNAASFQASPKIIRDSLGFIIVTWRDSRNYSSSGVDIYAQRLNLSGNGTWAANGVPVCTASGDQYAPILVADNTGGAIIAWNQQNPSTGWDVYAQRIMALGGSKRWAANGVGYFANGDQKWYGTPAQNPIVSDGANGAIIAWNDYYFGASDIDIRALRFDDTGAFAWQSATTPASRWVAGSSNNQLLLGMVGDGAGGTIMVWLDDRNGDTNTDIYAQHLDVSGVTHWTGWGEVICDHTADQKDAAIAKDTFGGAIVTWNDDRNGDQDVFAQRVDSFGNIQWATHGVEISTASNHQNSVEIASAGTCGAIITWTDYRWLGDPWDDTHWDIYAQRVFCDGNLGKLSGELAMDIASFGLWHLEGTTWTPIAWAVDVEDLERWDKGLVIDSGTQGPTGLWLYNPAGWSPITMENVDGMEAWANGLAVDRGANGLWNVDNQFNWSVIAYGLNVDGMARWGNGLAVDLGSSGLYYYPGWTPITNENVDGCAEWSGGLAIDRGTNGLWNYNGSNWTQLNPANPEGITRWGNGLVADFGGGGLHYFNGSNWTVIANENIDGMVEWEDGLVIDRGSGGLWNFDWPNQWTPIAMINVDSCEAVNMY